MVSSIIAIYSITLKINERIEIHCKAANVFFLSLEIKDRFNTFAAAGI
jgi:hypothetical protein